MVKQVWVGGEGDNEQQFDTEAAAQGYERHLASKAYLVALVETYVDDAIDTERLVAAMLRNSNTWMHAVGEAGAWTRAQQR